MGVPAEDLILRPFQEVAARGNDAVTNAGTCEDPELSEPLEKAGKAVAKEGERALKRLQPAWDAQIEKHGDAFRDAMVENKDIDAKRKILDDLLYDFEDYIEPDTFDADKFTELQAATKAFALATIDATKRVKIDEPIPPPIPKAPQAPPPRLSLFPPLPPLPPLPKARPGQRLSSPREHKPLQKRHTAPTVPALASAGIPTSPTMVVRPNFASGPPTQPPQAQSPIRPVGLERRESKGLSRNGSVQTQRSLPVPVHTVPEHLAERRPSSPEILGLGAGQARTISAAPRTSEWVQSHANSSRDQRTSKPPVTEQAIIEEDHVPELTPISKFAPLNTTHDGSDNYTPVTTPASAVFTDIRSSYYSSGNSTYSSQSDKREAVIAERAVAKTVSVPRRVRGQSEDTYKISTAAPMKDKPTGYSDQDFEPGLMLTAEISRAGSDTGTTTGAPQLREPDCSIGVKSTFQIMGGFCRGAEIYRRAGHTRGVKQSIGFVDNKQANTGRCVGCTYAHSYDEVKIDIDKRPQANFHKYGARFRLRLLYKSHIDASITSQRRSDPHYACLFCIPAGRTIHEGDATVFPSPDALMMHLIRHPQPLPPVEGIRVLYGDVPPTDEFAEDFDIHLPTPPMATEMGDAVGRSAVATAVRDHYQKFDTKKMGTPPSYGGEILQFLSGARIIGVTFPERWEGKWCMGWHNGVSGAFPSKCVEIEPPQQHEVPVGDGSGSSGSSGMCVRAKWKWQPRLEGAGNPDAAAEMWLSFDKGDVIKDVRSLYGDHWCWSGRDSITGRWGVFPQSHVLLESLGPESGGGAMGNASSGSSTMTKSKVKSRGFFLRKRRESVASTVSGSSGRVSMVL